MYSASTPPSVSGRTISFAVSLEASTSQPSEARYSTRFSVVSRPVPPPEQMSTMSANIAAAAMMMNTALLLLSFDFVTGHPSRLSIL